MTETKHLAPPPAVPLKKALQSQSTTNSSSPSTTPPSSIQSDTTESSATTIVTEFQAELCGSDRQNFVYIRSIEPSNLENYANLRFLIARLYTTSMSPYLPSSEVKAELCAMLKEGSDFHRVRILDKDKHGIVSCYKYDEGCVVKSTVSHIYPLDEQIKKIPQSVMKCRLVGLEFFDGMPTLEIAFKLIMMGNLLPNSFYDVTILQYNGQGIPLVRMIKDGLSLTNHIKEFIPTICHPHYPKFGQAFEGEVLNVNYKAMIWFRDYANETIFLKIDEKLQKYFNTFVGAARQSTYGILPPRPANLSSRRREEYDIPREVRPDQAIIRPLAAALEVPLVLSPEESWKEKYLKGPGAIFVTEFNNALYRAKILRILDIERKKVEVEFIDYGNFEVTQRDKVFPISRINEILAFIPPQCLRGRLQGFYKIHVPCFWRLMPSSDRVKMILEDSHLQEEEEEDFIREIKIFNVQNNPNKSINEVWIESNPNKGCVIIPKKDYKNKMNYDSYPTTTSGISYKARDIELFLAKNGF